jgi:hypothetical protein
VSKKEKYYGTRRQGLSNRHKQKRAQEKVLQYGYVYWL